MVDVMTEPGQVNESAADLNGTEANDAGETGAVVAARDWVDTLNVAIGARDSDALTALFCEDATWRDFMAFRWDFVSKVGRGAVVAALLEWAESCDATGFTLHDQLPPVVGDGQIEVFFDFTTSNRIDRGYVRLVRAGDGYAAMTVQSQITEIEGHPELVNRHRSEGKVYGIVPGRSRWRADRQAEAAFEQDEPAVLILGAGHNGLAVAARLAALDVPTLVVDRHARVGDQWRNRYEALALHSSVFGDHMPYLPLPPTWTAHTPKDKFADWLECYSTLMDVNVWTGTEYLDGDYDEVAQRWTIRVRREDGTIRELRPRHFFVAGGMFGAPKVPDISGIETFAGRYMHSDAFKDGADFAGKRALVVGSGVSGHEIVQDLYEHGADVTMVQRSSTYVVTYDSYHRFGNSLFGEEMTFPVEYADQVNNSSPWVRSVPGFKRVVEQSAEADRDLLDRLQSAGFKLNWGPEGTGVVGAHQSGYDGYQIDIGASQLIADGRVKLKQGVELASIDQHTVTFTDGSTLDVDVIVFATGYHQFWGHMGPSLGAAAAKIDTAYSRAADGEYANTWRRSAQPGLWFGSGFIRMARFYSRFSAFLIKAIELGIEPIDPDRR
ncbi:putative oxidoreductase [Gordonia rhizosphera NBRC 16068]|uniref:Putative oxidoreductase n=2 Tax=Gordonia rhizosphera TaxID=83341 RepID=K6X0P7_9ACTN|nr:putative oxidoreductase [Gordonia rhizosphera NBRC 16068]